MHGLWVSVILGERLSGPRVVGGHRAGCKIWLSGGRACPSVAVVWTSSRGCGFPACRLEVKCRRKDSHYPEWELPMWLPARPPAPSLSFLLSMSLYVTPSLIHPSFSSCTAESLQNVSFTLPWPPFGPPLLRCLSLVFMCKKRARTIAEEGPVQILQHPCGLWAEGCETIHMWSMCRGVVPHPSVKTEFTLILSVPLLVFLSLKCVMNAQIYCP